MNLLILLNVCVAYFCRCNRCVTHFTLLKGGPLKAGWVSEFSMCGPDAVARKVLVLPEPSRIGPVLRIEPSELAHLIGKDDKADTCALFTGPNLDLIRRAIRAETCQ
jgi:hypothetical protein